MDIDGVPSAKIPGFFEVQVKVSHGGQQSNDFYYVSADSATILKGEFYDLRKSPFESVDGKLRGGNQPSLGPPNAPVRLTMFADFQCPYCREEAKALRSVASAFPNEVRIAFQDFPLPSIHDWAQAAAVAGRCIFRQSEPAFWTFYDWVFERQSQLDAKGLPVQLSAFAKDQGLNIPDFNMCRETRDTEQDVSKSVEKGQELGVSATPTLFVNGRKIPGALSAEVLSKVIQAELEFQRALDPKESRASH